jgi:sugar/nucleoside kinase (ribokinase family)
MCVIISNAIDYLLIGHVTEDLQSDETIVLGGTVTYSGLTARALGHQPAIITSCSKETPLQALEDFPIHIVPSAKTTQFRNTQSENGRIQHLYAQARIINADDLPDNWTKPAIVHIAPVFNDVDPALLAKFPNSFRCLTPQGWMRDVDELGVVQAIKLENLDKWLGYAHAVVLSREDLQGDMSEAEKLAKQVPVLVVTERDKGALVFSNGQRNHFPAPSVKLVDDTGSGDIFAACFFHHLYRHKNVWQAARFAVDLASRSVSRPALDGIPTPEEIQKARDMALEQAVYG